ncbi:low-density lipoprotein receptor-related protein 1B-like isoform X2 [Varroa jacobsoni]|uniref:EGF-like domain-containing protein n=1 Tax=Varroa destructor TaxID=109461 RepID=A0A7M7MI04_VARDE|nr:low-density lipoprotein receptor-related protein 1B-like isoform X2 [Varroa destructor]XP_022705204.1 low-density lipoprotein receptor-related protein 1B-like isoform X2 [Varroa jacobsoni]
MKICLGRGRKTLATALSLLAALGFASSGGGAASAASTAVAQQSNTNSNNNNNNVHNEEEPAFLIAGVSSGLIRLSTDGETVRYPIGGGGKLGDPEVAKIFNSTSGSVITVDTVYKDDGLWVYWSTLRSIQKGRLGMHANQPVITDAQVLVNSYLESVEGLRIDWINDNLYWVESKKRHIEVARLDGSMRASLLGPLGKPRGLALDPRSDVLFWSDWNDRQPCIERNSLAGKKRRVIVNVTDYKGGLPNGLTLDLATKRVFWIDALSKAIHSTTYEGTEHNMVLSIEALAVRPFSIDILHRPTDEQVIIWTDFSTYKAFRGSKEIFSSRTDRIFHATVVHRSKKPNDVVKGPCRKNNGDCSHLCSTSCLCPYGTIHDPSNARSCVPHKDTFLYATDTKQPGLRVYLSDTKLHKFVFPPLRLNMSNTQVAFDASHDRLYWFENSVVMVHYYKNESTERFLNFGARYRIKALAIERHTIFVGFTVPVNGIPRHEVVACNMLTKNCANVAGDRGGQVVSLAVDRDKLFWLERDRYAYESDRISVKQSLINGSNEMLLHTMYIDRNHQPKRLKIMEDQVCFTEVANSTIFCVKQNVLYVANSSFHLSQRTTLGDDRESVEIAVTNDRKSLSYAKKFLIYLAGETEPRNVTDQVVAMDYFSKESHGSYRGGRFEDCGCPHGVCLGGRCVPSGGSDTLLYFLQSHKVAAFPLTQNLSLAPMVIHSELGDRNIDALHVANNGRVYVTIGPDLHESRLDGLGLKQLLRMQPPVVGKVSAIASDLLSGRLYFATCCAVYSTRLDGTDLQVVINGTYRIMGLAVHPVKKLLFWSESGGYSPKIERINLKDPRNSRRTIVNDDLIRLNGITVDGDHVYWCDSGTGMIGRSDLEGRHRAIVVQRSGNWHLSPVAVAVYHSVVFWIDSTYSGGALMFLQRGRRPAPSTWSRYLGPNVSHLQLYDKSILQGYNNSAALDGGSRERMSVFDPVISCQGFCLNGGSCELPPNDAPLVIGVGPQCLCQANYTGNRCQYLASYLFDQPVLHRDEGMDLKVILLPLSVGVVLIPILCLISWWRTRRVWRDAMQSRCSLSSNRDNHNLEALPIDAQYETSFAQDADNISWDVVDAD